MLYFISVLVVVCTQKPSNYAIPKKKKKRVNVIRRRFRPLPVGVEGYSYLYSDRAFGILIFYRIKSYDLMVKNIIKINNTSRKFYIIVRFF